MNFRTLEPILSRDLAGMVRRLSPTPKERKNPDIITPARRKRIATGAGKDIAEMNAFMKQFEQMSKMMKIMQGPQGKQMMQMMTCLTLLPL